MRQVSHRDPYILPTLPYTSPSGLRPFVRVYLGTGLLHLAITMVKDREDNRRLLIMPTYYILCVICLVLGWCYLNRTLFLGDFYLLPPSLNYTSAASQ